MASRLYMDDHNGGMFHHHEGWVLDDGTPVPGSPEACSGGGMGNSEAEPPWAIFFQPYRDGRGACFCPSDSSPRSQHLSRTLEEYNGAIESVDEQLPPDSELAVAEREGLNLHSSLLNSVFTHKSARYAVERALPGFATDALASVAVNENLIVFGERNSEAMNASDDEAYGSIGQDDFDAWVGEGALVRWGAEAGSYAPYAWTHK